MGWTKKSINYMALYPHQGQSHLVTMAGTALNSYRRKFAPVVPTAFLTRTR